MADDVTQSAMFYKSWAWVHTHQKQLLWGAGFVVVVGCIAGFLLWQQGQKQIVASEALAKLTSHTAANAPVESPEALLKIAADYPDTGAAGRALLLAGAKFFDAGKYPDARAQFEKFLSQYRSSIFAGQALFGVAVSLDAEGKTNEAITAYKDIAERHPSENIAAPANLALARLYEAQGKLEQARDCYEQLAQARYGSLGSDAAMSLQDLIIKHPGLAITRSASTNALRVAAPK
jgi:TolA-binding protein